MPVEVTVEARVRSDFLNFDVSHAYKIKNKFLIRGRRHWDYIFVEF